MDSERENAATAIQSQSASPARLAKSAGTDTTGSLTCTSAPEVGARCVSSARRDLYGGCRATGIPTVTNVGVMCRFENRKPDVPPRLPAFADTAAGTHSCCRDNAYKIYSQ